MAIVDERGRLFGRFNLVDAVLAVFLLGLVPLAYGGYLLFRTPLPRLTSIEPATLVAGPNMVVSIKGENLKPYLRVSFGDYQGATFIFRSSTAADITLNPMPAGVYDVILYDFAQERSRLPKALTVSPSPLPASQVIVAGSFGDLTADLRAKLSAGMVLEGVGTIVEVGTPVPDATRVYAGSVVEIQLDNPRLPATLRLNCLLRAPQGSPQCAVGDVMIQATGMLILKTPVGTFPFQIDQVRGVQPLEQVRAVIRFAGLPRLLGQIRKDDVDRGPFNNALAAGGKVVEISAPLRLGEDAVQYDVTIAIQAQRGASGWIYSAAPLRVGMLLAFRTPRYEVTGTMIQVTPEWAPVLQGK